MMTFDAALDHIRAAYPHGVPPEQHVALAELLARTVGPHRTERLLETLGIQAGDLLGPAAASAEQLGDVAGPVRDPAAGVRAMIDAGATR